MNTPLIWGLQIPKHKTLPPWKPGAQARNVLIYDARRPDVVVGGMFLAEMKNM